MSVQTPPVSTSTQDLREQVHEAARRARVAARTLATLNTATKNRALHAAADSVLASADAVLAANAGDLDRYHLLHAARADFLRRLGSRVEAARSYAMAIKLVTNDAERRFLERRLREVQSAD